MIKLAQTQTIPGKDTQYDLRPVMQPEVLLEEQNVFPAAGTNKMMRVTDLESNSDSQRPAGLGHQM